MARGVEQVEHAAAALEGHDGGDHGNSTFPCSMLIQSERVRRWRSPFGAHVAGKLDTPPARSKNAR